MHTRLMERTNSMRRGKRSLEGPEEEDQQPEPKRPALASVIVEALKVDSLQKLCSSLEPILRRVVSEEVERALAKLGPAKLTGRSSPKKIEGLDGRNLQLHFRSRLSLPLFTGGKVEGEQGAAIHVVLIDANTGHVVTSGPESSAKLDIVVLEGDFNNEDDENWTEQEFNSHVVKEREGKRPLLTGDLQVTLKEGVGTLADLTFTDNSSWIRSRKFRLGLKVTQGYFEGRIREAKTEAITVKDHRGELYKKHYPPALNDEVWRLEKIGKDGSFHKRLNKAGIFSVEEFLRLVVRDSQKLRKILGSGMSNKMWDALIEHAKTCVLGGKLYVYYRDESRNIGVAFNNIYELSGLITGEQYYSADSLSESQKVFVDSLVKKAYDNWNQVVEYDGQSLISLKQTNNLIPPRNQLSMNPGPPMNYNNPIPYNLRLPLSIPSESSSVDPNMLIGGYNSYSTQSQLMNTSIGTHSNPIQNMEYNNDSTGSQSFETVQQSNNINHFGNDNEILSEEDIRMRSHEMLANDDMQDLLRLLHANNSNNNILEDGFDFQSYIPSPSLDFNFDKDQTRPGKAVVGWLKIKAAMRWGFFIRRKAAERRRAQIVQLDD